MPKPEKPVYHAPALDKGLDIIECLSASRVSLSLAEIAHQLGRKQNELFRMITCLEERGYVIREEASAKFRLSLKLFSVVSQQTPIEELRRATQLPMEILAEELGCSCHLSVIHGANILVLNEIAPTQKVTLNVGVGNSWPLYKTASGRFLLSRHPKDSILKILNSSPLFIELAPSAQDQILEEILSLSELSVYNAESEYTPTTADMCCMLGSLKNGTLAALAVSYLTSSDNVGWEEALLEIASSINRNLGVGV